LLYKCCVVATDISTGNKIWEYFIFESSKDKYVLSLKKLKKKKELKLKDNRNYTGSLTSIFGVPYQRAPQHVDR
jgi:hypothetical protein